MLKIDFLIVNLRYMDYMCVVDLVRFVGLYFKVFWISNISLNNFFSQLVILFLLVKYESKILHNFKLGGRKEVIFKNEDQ